MAGDMMQALKNLTGLGDAYKDSGVDWLLLYCTDVLQKDNERLKAINKQLMAKF